MSCADNAKFMGPVSLFLGIETADWNIPQFVQAAQFAKQHNITTLIVKCSEVGSKAGDIWYGGMSQVQAIVQAIKGTGVNVLTYQFIYGDTDNNLTKEIEVANEFLNAFNSHCLDMEGSIWSNPLSSHWASAFNQALVSNNGKLFLSMPANPIESGQGPSFQNISPCVNVWMPMVYSNYLDTTWRTQLAQINNIACIQPTLDLSNEFGANDPLAIAKRAKASNILSISLWEYQFATANPGLTDAIVNAMGGGTQPVAIQTNNKGMVLDVVESYQLETGESEDLCGPWAVSSLLYAGLPNKGARGTAEMVDVWTDNEVNKYMTGGQTNWQGSSIGDMYNFMTDAIDPQSHQRAIHWWDITPDLNRIRIALRAGYPVLVTANEQNVQEKSTGKRPPYPWNLNANHIFPLMGLDKDNDFIVADELNNNFQNYWPVVYKADVLQPSWASVIQVVGPNPSNPWLKPIPSGDPTNWPANFNAQNFAGGTVPTSNFKQQSADQMWGAFFAQLFVAYEKSGAPAPSDATKSIPPTGSGIYKSWLNDFNAGKYHGPAMSWEYGSIDFNGHAIVKQLFGGGWYEWSNGNGTWFSYS